jgi:hypothetical protein
MANKITSIKDSQARQFVQTLLTMHNNISKTKNLPKDIRPLLEELAKRTDDNPFFAELKKGTDRTNRIVRESLNEILIGAKAGIDLTKELKELKKISTKTISNLERKVNALLVITSKFASAKPTTKKQPEGIVPKITKKQAGILYKEAFNLYKAGIKVKLDPSPAKNITVFKKISQFAGELIKLIEASQLGTEKKQLLITKKQMNNLKKIRDTLEDGFHFENAYRNVKREKSLVKKLELMTAMLNKIQTAPNMKPTKNTSSKQLKKFILYVKGFDSKIRSQITKKIGKKLTTAQLVELIIAYKKLLDLFIEKIKTPQFTAGITKIDNTGALRMTGTKAINEIKNIHKRLGTGPTPLYLPFELHNIKKIKKDLPQQIKLFTNVIQKIVTTDDKRSTNDVLKLIIAIRKLDPQIEEKDVEPYKKLLIATKNKFANYTRVNKKNTYKKLVKLTDGYSTKPQPVKFYELMYNKLDKSKVVTQKLKLIEEILKAPDEFFVKKKKLRKYRRRVKDQIINLAKKITPTLINQYSKIIETALRNTKNFNQYKNSLRRALLVPFKDDLKAFKDAHADEIVYTRAIKKLEDNYKKKLALKEKLEKDKAEREAAGKKFRDPKKLKRTEKWITEYKGRNPKLKQEQLIASSKKKRIEAKLGTAPRLVQEELKNIVKKKTKPNAIESLKIRKLSK